MKFLRHITNQRLRLMAIALMVGTITLDAGVMEMRYLVPDTVRPSDSNFVANPASNGAVLVRLADAEGKPCDVIFIGASNVEYWLTEGHDVWDKYYAPRHAFNFGVAGDRTENVLWRMDHMELQAIKPKVAVVFIGLNNFKSTARATALGVKAIALKSKSVFPGIKVIIVSITPNFRENDGVIRENALLAKLADNKTIFFFDLYSQLPPDGDNWKGMRPDHLHLDHDGYEIWAEKMEPLMQTLLANNPPTLGKVTTTR